MARTEVRGTFSQFGPRRPASAGRLARTLGSVKPTLQHLTGISAYRRSLNSHEQTRPRGYLAMDLQVNATVAKHSCRRHQTQMPRHIPPVCRRKVKPSQVELLRLSREQSLKSVHGAAAVNAAASCRIFGGGFELLVQAASCNSPPPSIPRCNYKSSGTQPLQRRSRNATLPKGSLANKLNVHPDRMQ